MVMLLLSCSIAYLQNKYTMKLFFMMFCLLLFSIGIRGQDIIYTLPHGGGSTLSPTTGMRLDYVIGQYFYSDAQQINTGLLDWVLMVEEVPTSITSVKADDPVMQVYPNPAKTYVTLDLFSNYDEKNTWTVALYNNLGQVVQQRSWLIKVGKNYLHLDVRDLPNATYFIKVSPAKETLFKTYQLIKQ